MIWKKNMKAVLKKIVKFLVPYGIITIYINKRKKIISEEPNTFEYILKNLKQRGILANTVIDIGASDGRWSNDIIHIFPQSQFFLIEANDFHKNGLESFKTKNNNVEYIIAAAGDELGQIYFDNEDPFAGLAMHEKPEGNCITVPVVTVDHCVCKNNLSGPFLLKLDTHGFEIPILNGATNVLKDTNIIIVEAYNFKIAKDCLLFWEMCEYLVKKGFRPCGIIDVMYRPKDNFLWQMDLVFVNGTREEYKDNYYS
jgi:FkbM family methyltransferase